MFGGVPIRVTMPPRIDAKASGMSTSRGGRSFRRQASSAAGISSASAPTLFMKPDSPAASAESTLTCPVCDPDALRIRRAIPSAAPETDSARLMIRTPATVTTAGCPRPENAWFPSTRPRITATINPPTATTS